MLSDNLPQQNLAHPGVPKSRFFPIPSRPALSAANQQHISPEPQDSGTEPEVAPPLNTQSEQQPEQNFNIVEENSLSVQQDSSVSDDAHLENIPAQSASTFLVPPIQDQIDNNRAFVAQTTMPSPAAAISKIEAQPMVEISSVEVQEVLQSETDEEQPTDKISLAAIQAVVQDEKVEEQPTAEISLAAIQEAVQREKVEEQPTAEISLAEVQEAVQREKIEEQPTAEISLAEVQVAMQHEKVEEQPTVEILPVAVHPPIPLYRGGIQPPLPAPAPWLMNPGSKGPEQVPARPVVLAKTSRKRRKPWAIALLLIAILVVTGGLLGKQYLSNGAPPISLGTPNFPGNGPYAQIPLSASEINAIQNLSGQMKYQALASLYVARMSEADKIGQLIMVEYNQTSYSNDLDYMINTLHVGGVITYEFQMNTFNQTKSDITEMQSRANIPLLVATDEEGGPYVQRLNNIYGSRMGATDIAATGDVSVAAQQGLKVSQDLAALGLNMDLAPDVDVNQVNGFDMVGRTFGTTSDQVIQFAGAYLQAMQANGTIGTIKHFPGLGGAVTDAHTTLPIVKSSKQQIYDVDLAPFKAFIQSQNTLENPGAIMSTDVLMPSIDPKYPAEISPTFITDILRNELGYNGVVMTDALYMQGITDTWDMNTAAVMALQAGDDMLLGANGTQQTIDMINAIQQALSDGQLTQARIDQSATRIIALKMQYHLMPTDIPGM